MYLGNKRLDLDRPVDADDGLMLGVRLDSHTLAHLASLYLPQHPFHRLAWVKSMRVDLLGHLLPLAPMDPQAKVGLELPLPILRVKKPGDARLSQLRRDLLWVVIHPDVQARRVASLVAVLWVLILEIPILLQPYLEGQALPGVVL